MGCTQSKVIEATDVYRPAPTSFALFDINSVEEPWVINNKGDDDQEEVEEDEKIVHVPAPILEKLDKFELAPDNGPHSWSEVSKALEDLKPALNNQKPTVVPMLPKPEPEPINQVKPSPLKKPNQQQPTKSPSFHTLEELDTKLSSKPVESLNKSVAKRPSESQLAVFVAPPPPPPSDSQGGYKPLKDNLFVMKDRLEREKEGKMANFDRIMRLRRDPLMEYPDKCPPNGSDSVVLYTTTLRGVRRTFEDCNRARSIIEGHRVMMDERDVSLHGKFLNELKDLLGEGVSVPRLFVKGKYIGGVDEVMELNETSRLEKILKTVGKNIEEWSINACQGCGGARFVPCLECGGSCKVLIGDNKQRCPKCNENGLLQCPLCHST